MGNSKFVYLDEKGKYVFDYDAMQALTSKEFVNAVKDNFDLCKDFPNSVVVEKNEYFLKVFIETQGNIIYIKFYFEGQSFRSIYITENDVKLMHNISNGDYRTERTSSEGEKKREASA